MSDFRFRPYQDDGIEAVIAKLRQYDSTLLVAATGTGKTVMFAGVCSRWPKEWGRILIMAHRREIVFQTRRTVKSICGEQVDLELDFSNASHGGGMFGPPPRIVVAGKDALLSRLSHYDPRQFGLVITDECHHAVKKNRSYWTIIKHFSRAKNLGVTATPDRLDNESLKGVYESVAYQYDILQAVEDSWLVPIQQQAVFVKDLDFSKIKLNRAGDMDQDELDHVMKSERIAHRIVNPVIDLANSGGKSRRALLFATSVEQARIMADVINRRCQGKAVALSGEDEKDNRDHALAKFKSGEYQYLCGCEVFTEGFDEPTIQIVVPKPTMARSKYAQMIGRGTRPWPGVIDRPDLLDDVEARRLAIRNSPKPSLLVLDFCGVSGQHKLINAVDVLSGVFSPEVVAKAKDRLLAKGLEGGRGELLRELREAKKRLAEEESERRRNIVAKAIYEMRPVDPFDLFAVSKKKEPKWLRGKRATYKQIQYITRNAPEGTVLPDDMSLHEASVLIESIKERRDSGPPTEKMSLVLQRFGYDTKGMKYVDAKKILDELAATGWGAKVQHGHQD